MRKSPFVPREATLASTLRRSFSGLWLVVAVTVLIGNSPDAAVGQLLAVALCAGFCVHAFLLRSRRAVERERLLESVTTHYGALSRNLALAIKRNDYGAVVSDRRNEAISEFTSSIGLNHKLIRHDAAAKIVLEQIDIQRASHSDGFDPGNLPSNGHDFERWVAEALNKFGWDTHVTAGSGDQGIDVIATRGRYTLGLQCKLYGSPVGNKAVQEAYAGKSYYGVDAVGVLTNTTFTSSARDIAVKTGVWLLSQHDIPNLFETVFRAQLAPRM